MELVKALAKAQAEIKNAPLNKVNPHFKSKYADLAAIRDAVVPVLSKHGIAMVQKFSVHDGIAYCVTELRMGDDVIASECPIIADLSGKPQAFGSAQTYARRYSLAAICGIAAEEDDDGNAAEKGNGPKPRKTTKANWKKHFGDADTDIHNIDNVDDLKVWLDKFGCVYDRTEGGWLVMPKKGMALDMANECTAWWAETSGDFICLKERIENRLEALEK